MHYILWHQSAQRSYNEFIALFLWHQSVQWSYNEFIASFCYSISLYSGRTKNSLHYFYGISQYSGRTMNSLHDFLWYQSVLWSYNEFIALFFMVSVSTVVAQRLHCFIFYGISQYSGRTMNSLHYSLWYQSVQWSYN